MTNRDEVPSQSRTVQERFWGCSGRFALSIVVLCVRPML